jgi:hypothetical protein
MRRPDYVRDVLSLSEPVVSNEQALQALRTVQPEAT